MTYNKRLRKYSSYIHHRFSFSFGLGKENLHSDILKSMKEFVDFKITIFFSILNEQIYEAIMV